MADAKISALPASTTPLVGTEVLPVVQSSTTKKVSVANLTAGRSVAVLDLTSTNDSSVNGLTVGRGGGAVSTNTALGASALAGGTTAGGNTAVGANAGKSHSTGGNSTYFGKDSGFTNVAGNFNTFLGLASGYTSNYGGNAYNTCAGAYSGYGLTTGIGNTFVGSGPSYNGAGSGVTSGNYNTIVGAYDGSTAPISATGSNYIVFSDGQGNVPAYFYNGNLVIGTANKGINFTANTPAAGMTSQLLNDYEEGTWTPTYTGSTSNPTVTYELQTGRYTKVGRLVTCTCRLSTSGITGAGSGNLQISGLPFTPASGMVYAGSIGYVTWWTNYPLNIVINGAVTYINLAKRAAINGTDAWSQTGDMANGNGYNYSFITISYFV